MFSSKKLIINMSKVPPRKRRKHHMAAQLDPKTGSYTFTPTGAVLVELGAAPEDLERMDDVFTAALRELPMKPATRKALTAIEAAGNLTFFWDELDEEWRAGGPMEPTVNNLNSLCREKGLNNLFFMLEGSSLA